MGMKDTFVMIVAVHGPREDLALVKDIIAAIEKLSAGVDVDTWLPSICVGD